MFYRLRGGAILVVLCACGHAPAKGADAVSVAPAGDELQIGAGARIMCARIGGRVHCIDGDYATTAIASGPPVGGIEDAVDLSVGPEHVCIVTKRGTVHCFGSNSYGELGRPRAGETAGAYSRDPLEVPGVTGARRAFAAYDHTCAVALDGAAWCWGQGQPPTRLAGLDGIVEIAGTMQRACARATNGDVACWETRDFTAPPTRMPAIAGTTSLAGMHSLFCGVRGPGGDVYCFGSLYTIIHGAGPNDTEAPLPVDVHGAVKIGTTGERACALMRDGSVTCWGAHVERYEPDPPARVPGISGARDLVVGRTLACAVMAPEDVRCWGELPWPRMGAPVPLDSPTRIRIR